MYPMRLLVAAGLAAFALPGAAAAQDTTPARGVFKSGEQIYVDCIADDQIAVRRCEWFLMGAYDMASYFQDTDQVVASFCLPQGTGAETVRKIAVERWQTKPETRRFSAVSGFLNALDEKYPGPCKDGPKR